MTQIQVDIPQKIADKFSNQSNISYSDIIEDYEKSFEYENIDMKAKNFKDFLIWELSHD